MKGQQAPWRSALHVSGPPLQTALTTEKLRNWYSSQNARRVKQIVSTPENGVENRFFFIQDAGPSRTPAGGAIAGTSVLRTERGCTDWVLMHHLSTIAKFRLKAFIAIDVSREIAR